MLERILNWLKTIWGKILEWWGKFNARQKTLIISLTAAVIVAVVVVVSVISQPEYKTLIVSDSTKQTSEVQTLLQENNITFKT